MPTLPRVRAFGAVRRSTALPALIAKNQQTAPTLPCRLPPNIRPQSRPVYRLAIALSVYFQELDYRPTPIGALSLRKRRELKLGVDVFEIKLGDEFLMSSLFTASEIALARLGLAELSGDGLDVVVGGLGLGYTAKAVLEHQKVGALLVVEALEAVIDWHREGLVPLGHELTGDLRCRFIRGDFFALAASDTGFDPAAPARRFDAVLVDIDHSLDLLLDPRNAAFYGEEGLSRLAAHLHPGGVFGLWSNDRPDDTFTARLCRVFTDARAVEVTFHNPLQDKPFTQTVYLAAKPVTPAPRKIGQ
jgi:spermidine synthase